VLKKAIHTALVPLCLATAAHAQAVTDSTHLTGACPSRAAASVNWDEVVTSPDVPAHPSRESTVMPPPNMRTRSEAILGRAVVSMVIDAAGKVVPGTVTVLESTDHELSAWMCMTIPTARFEPATVAGRRVVSLMQQPYSFGGLPPWERKNP
jgi:hypothetical protein